MLLHLLLHFFSGNDTGLCKNDILDGVFGVDCNEYVFDNEVINEINDNCKFIFIFKTFFVRAGIVVTDFV